MGHISGRTADMAIAPMGSFLLAMLKEIWYCDPTSQKLHNTPS